MSLDRLRRNAGEFALAALTVSFLPLGPARAQSTPFRHVWAGNVFDGWTSNDGLASVVAEDGGRIRYRNLGGAWLFQTVPDGVKDHLLRVNFLEPDSPPEHLVGWAVGLNGWFLETPSLGSPWSGYQFPSSSEPEELWDVAFTDELHGWLVSLHNVYRTISGGHNAASWDAVTLKAKDGHTLSAQELSRIHLYALDVEAASDVPNPPAGKDVVGILVGKPGLIFINTDPDGAVWQVVYDMYTDLCGTEEQPSCLDGYCDSPPSALGFAIYDVEISHHASNRLALAVGGNASGCGMVLASDDHGANWHSERHECCLNGLDPCTDCDIELLYDDYHDDPGTNTDTWKIDRLNELYSVSIFDADNTAIAAGYGGQHLRRDANGVWHDHSQYSNDLVHAVGGITNPMYGTSADTGGLGTGKGLISGAGGYIRRTSDGGQSWTTEVAGDPWRLRDVYFVDQSLGFAVGQWFRIGRTMDAGVSWDFVVPEPVPGPNLLAITFDSSAFRGATVGESPSGGTPKVLFTNSTPIGASWSSGTLSDLPGTTSTDKALRDVDWAGGLHFWAAGQSGLIYHSVTGGPTWDQFVPSGQTWTEFSRFEIEALAFRDTQTGVFVGSKNGEAAAFLYLDNSGTVTWTEIALPELAGLLAIHDVDLDVANDKVYAIATRLDAEEDEFGLLLVKNGIASTTSAFQTTGVEVAACEIGDDLASVPTLHELEVAPGGAVWIGGECGRVYRYTDGPPATEFKSQTDAHVRGISFPAAGSGNLGYFGCFRIGRAGWSVVKYAPGS